MRPCRQDPIDRDDGIVLPAVEREPACGRDEWTFRGPGRDIPVGQSNQDMSQTVEKVNTLVNEI